MVGADQPIVACPLPPSSDPPWPPLPPWAPLPTVVVATQQGRAGLRLKQRTRVCYRVGWWGYLLKECAAVAHFLCAWRAFVGRNTAGWLNTIHCLGLIQAMQLGLPSSPVQKMHSTSPAAPTIQQGFLNLRGTSSSESKFVFTISPPQFAYISTFRYFGQVEREVQGPFSLWPKMCMNSSFLRLILPSSNWRVYV